MPKTIRVLVVDDDPVDLELTRRLISAAPRRSFQVEAAQRLDEAVAQIREQKYDVMLLDLNLPGSYGLATLEAVRHENHELPVIVLSGLSDEETALRSLDHGAQDYLVKGQFTSDMLVNAVRYAMQRQQLLQEITCAKALVEKKNQRLAEMYETAHRFVDNVSHEFRTPLTVIKEYTSLIRDGLVGEITDEQKSFLDIVNDRADDLNTMVDDMLDVGRLEAGRLGAWRKNCTAAGIIARLRPSLERKAFIKETALAIEVAADLPAVYCDDEKAGRVLINLTVNAIKFCQQRGQVRISATRDRRFGGVAIAVTDNGPGIDDAHREEIFERFKQLNTDVRSSCKGFGLGLNIAKVLVDMNFGEMDLESTVGKGSTFTFTLLPAQPLKVMKRYLHRMKSVPDFGHHVSLVTAHIDETTDAASAGDVDWYLNSLLRRNDLLFRLAACRWMLVIAAGEQEMSQFLAGAEKTLHDVNRNRPQGPLPTIATHVEGAWDVSDQESELWTALHELLESQEVACG
ncbi:MAG TPA: HAMP domain-containing sensor histidine kinase [Pirellulales bacterium]|nr:HAMP domain-containing sensor histidine kinase [Pirellulales bacterium]